MPDPRLSEIFQACCETIGVFRADVFSGGRSKRLVLTRRLYVGSARRMTIASYPEISAVLGRRTHSTAYVCERHFAAFPEQARAIWIECIGRRIVMNRALQKPMPNPDRENIAYWCAWVAQMIQENMSDVWVHTARRMAESFEHSAARRIA